ncbi:class I SAM-dependent methyltransferase [Kordiimonas aestuarii]|uniref:class I SAM-dependent methyltransferase n=1 Tax=Kordiimonas aestuarii TaxID=1005925 RepID=UPI0021D1C756|nr:class I SAM-dependent methyltransferase [Kordiimonas aestuarii]
MSKFFDPQAHDGEAARLHAPATARNRNFILELLEACLQRKGTLLEIASGTGEHAAHMAPKLAPLLWQPTDIDDRHLTSIDAWRNHVGAENLLPVRRFNVLEDDWQFDDLPAPISAIAAINLIHIAPWEVAVALMKGAGKTLPSGGTLYLYGPYKQHGKHTASSNAAFDLSLKRKNPAWGVRDMEAVMDLADSAGFADFDIVGMPANNFSLIFTRG